MSLPGGSVGGRSDDAPDWRNLVVLVAANVVPVVGVMAWGWDLGAILFLYVLETAVVGLVNVPKTILAARGPRGTAVEDPGASRYVDAATNATFLVVTYAVLLTAQWAVLIGLFLQGGDWFALASTVAVGVAGLTVHHATDFYLHFWRPETYRERTVDGQLPKNILRIFLVTLVLVVGGAAAGATGESVAVLLALVGGKTAVDLGSWYVRRRPTTEVVGGADVGDLEELEW